MGARTELVDLLEDTLPAHSLIVPDLSKLTTDPDPEALIVAQLFRRTIAPTEFQDRFAQTFELWICSTQKDPTLVEDLLDDVLDDVVEMLVGTPAFTFPGGFTRAVHASGFQGYKCDDLTLASTAKE